MPIIEQVLDAGVRRRLRQDIMAQRVRDRLDRATIIDPLLADLRIARVVVRVDEIPCLDGRRRRVVLLVDPNVLRTVLDLSKSACMC